MKQLNPVFCGSGRVFKIVFCWHEASESKRSLLSCIVGNTNFNTNIGWSTVYLLILHIVFSVSFFYTLRNTSLRIAGSSYLLQGVFVPKNIYYKKYYFQVFFNYILYCI